MRTLMILLVLAVLQVPCLGQELRPGSLIPPLPGAASPEQLSGPQGLVLVVFRSADWWPYCKVQLVQLQEARSELEKMGYGVAALSYDDPAIVGEFAQRKALDYPILSDPESAWLRQAGLMNLEASGMAAGVALPATMVLDPDGTVQQIFRESAYQDRLTPAALIGILKGAQAPVASLGDLPEEVQLVQAQSDTAVTAGSLFTVSVDVRLPRGHHMYGPEVETAIPVSLVFEEHPLLEVVTVEYPTTQVLRLLDEDVAVVEGVATLQARVKVRSDKELRDRLGELSQMPLRARLEYQICTDRVCLAPANHDLEWTLRYQPLDLERSPQPLRHSSDNS